MVEMHSFEEDVLCIFTTYGSTKMRRETIQVPINLGTVDCEVQQGIGATLSIMSRALYDSQFSHLTLQCSNVKPFLYTVVLLHRTTAIERMKEQSKKNRITKN